MQPSGPESTLGVQRQSAPGYFGVRSVYLDGPDLRVWPLAPGTGPECVCRAEAGSPDPAGSFGETEGTGSLVQRCPQRPGPSVPSSSHLRGPAPPHLPLQPRELSGTPRPLGGASWGRPGPAGVPTCGPGREQAHPWLPSLVQTLHSSHGGAWSVGGWQPASSASAAVAVASRPGYSPARLCLLVSSPQGCPGPLLPTRRQDGKAGRPRQVASMLSPNCLVSKGRDSLVSAQAPLSRLQGAMPTAPRVGHRPAPSQGILKPGGVASA